MVYFRLFKYYPCDVLMYFYVVFPFFSILIVIFLFHYFLYFYFALAIT
jgi:hypothetical protein